MMLLLPFLLTLQGDAAFLGAPISYEEPARLGPVEVLAARLAAGEAELAFDPDQAYLPALLAALEIPVSSQVLVFSRTSFQNTLISPRTPRAIYFGDDVYVGTIPGAPIAELTSIDPERGPVFYTLSMEEARGPRIVRRDAECLQCHAGPRTQEWPGNLVRSVHPDRNGEPLLRSGTTDVTPETPIEERWGGWYVTGTHGDVRHLGNAIADPESERIDPERGANLRDVSERFEAERYLTPHSDLVALLVMEHQAEMHNAIARAGYGAKLALAREADTNAAFGEPLETHRASTERVLTARARELLDALLFAGEAPLGAPMRGTAPFAAEFSARGRRDPLGRSLRELDLETRLLRHPCSWLVHSPSFDALPPRLLEVVWEELDAILSGSPEAAEHPQLSAADRRAIREILVATQRGVPDTWR